MQSHLYQAIHNSMGGGGNQNQIIQTQINIDDLIIGGGYPGLGDNLFFSHLPRIAKESKKYNKVYIYNAIPERNVGSMQLIWGDNPLVIARALPKAIHESKKIDCHDFANPKSRNDGNSGRILAKVFTTFCKSKK